MDTALYCSKCDACTKLFDKHAWVPRNIEILQPELYNSDNRRKNVIMNRSLLKGQSWQKCTYLCLCVILYTGQQSIFDKPHKSVICWHFINSSSWWPIIYSAIWVHLFHQESLDFHQPASVCSTDEYNILYAFQVSPVSTLIR